MNQNRQCKQCGKPFAIDATDVEFLKKLSPFEDEKLTITPSSLCPSCKMTTLMAWRNERSLHKLKCALCKNDIISVYSEDKKFNVLCRDCFWSDKWDATHQGIGFDFKSTFFKQFAQLLKTTKLLSLFSTNNENCEFVNQETDDNNCYLCVGGNTNDECYYCTYAAFCRDCIDCLGITNSENLHDCTFCISCYGSQGLFNCNVCRDCYFCEDCIGCENCFGSINLRYKKYFFFNEELPKDEYITKIREYLDSEKGSEKAKKEFAKHRLNFIFKYANRIFCEGKCTGDILIRCKNVENVYYSNASENAKNAFLLNKINDVMDGLAVGRGELVYYSGSSPGLFSTAFSSSCFKLRNSYYCYMCYNSNNLFGCIGLNHKEYCILNKQYSKKDYEEILPRIIEQMKEPKEWGEFFPISLSPFAYNESFANEFFRLDKNEAKSCGVNWSESASREFKGEEYHIKDLNNYNIKYNKEAEQEIKKCLDGIVKCAITKRPFKITARELAQYIERNIQLPTKHPDQRNSERLKLLNKMDLYHRKCMNGSCTNEFETTYAPDRPEKVYCEECYQKEVI
jgi:hypothetical protein